MKKTLLYLLLFACSSLHLLTLAQSPGRKVLARPAQMQRREASMPLLTSPEPASQNTVLSSPLRRSNSANKIAAVSPVSLGSASNVYSVVRPTQNQVIAVDSLDVVAFIHRNDINVFGGSSGHLRYDVSIDGGSTFSNDIGALNLVLQQPARYPQIAALNLPGGNNNPANANFVYVAPTLSGSGSGFDGHVVGVSNIVTSGQATTTEHYLYQGMQSLLPGGLHQSAPGKYWVADAQSQTGGGPTGDVFVYRGDYNSGTGDVDWMRTDTIPVNHYTALNGGPFLLGPNIAFSPDGQTGWVAWLGDLNGFPDSTIQPILSKSTDCGQTWSAPMEVNLNSVPWVKDSLQTLWIDSLGNPASDGRASCAFDFDLTVDDLGNPHFATVICTGIEYSVSSGLAKFLGDVTTINGGATWDINYISPVLTLRTPVFGTSPNTVAMDNYPQVSRDMGGCNIFYSWVDSDTSLVTGNQNGIGFGESANLAPNLRIAARNVSGGMQTYPKLVSDLDLLWDGSIFFPTLAPIVRSTAAGWNLPIVTSIMSGNDPINAASFHYFGNDAFIPNAGWCPTASMQLSWDYFAFSGFQSNCPTATVPFCNSPINGPCVPTGLTDGRTATAVLGEPMPNPTSGSTRIRYTLPAIAEARLSLHNALGQEMRTLATGEQAAGEHVVDLSTSQLPSGIYFIRLITDGQQFSSRLIVNK